MENRTLCIRVIERARELLGDIGFIGRHRTRPEDFTRQRCFSFPVVMLLVLQKTLKSIQLHLQEFFEALSKEALQRRVASDGAWTQARAKLKHTAFIELNKEAVLKPLEASAEDLLLWRGMRLISNDSSLLRLPWSEVLFAHFGGQEVIEPDGTRKVRVPHARLSVAYDCLNRVAIDARVGTFNQGEIGLALEHLGFLRPGNLWVGDRGYSSYVMLARLRARNINFVVRCKRHSFREADELFSRNEDGASITTSLSAKRARGANPDESLPETICVRFVSVRLSSGELEVLVTSLLDEESFPPESLKEVYHWRWGVESFYGQLKGLLDLENLSGLTVEAMLQDIHAAVFLCGLESILSREAQNHLNHPSSPPRSKRHQQKVNHHVSFHTLKSRVIDLLIGKDPAEKVFAELTALFLAKPVAIRPERSSPRYPPRTSRSLNYQKRVRKITF